MADGPGGFTITLDNVNDYEFRVKFDKDQYPELWMDEPPPLGGDKAPNAGRLLAAAIGNCLSASLLFCTRKARVPIEGVHAEVKVSFARNEKGRVRIGKIDVVLDPRIDRSDPQAADRCLALFEEYCTVTASIRQGIDVAVTVK